VKLLSDEALALSNQALDLAERLAQMHDELVAREPSLDDEQMTIQQAIDDVDEAVA